MLARARKHRRKQKQHDRRQTLSLPSKQNKKVTSLFLQKNAGADYVMLLKINNNLMGYHIINYNLIMNYNYKLF